MNGLIIIDKEKDLTSRDVVNQISKKLNTKKVGHGGTLDPLATGVLVIGVGKYTKLLNLITDYEKEYIAEVLVGIKTDTLDITGKILEEQDTKEINKEKLEKTIKSFKKKYLQEIPKYSAKRINGKKLYEYARENIDIKLPKKEVEIIDIKLLDIYQKENKLYFKIYTKVSKGTFIRSLINDIGEEMDIPMTMSDLRRISQGRLKIEESTNVDNIKLLKISDFMECKTLELNDGLYKKVINGNKINIKENDQYILFTQNNKEIALYQKEKDCYISLLMLE